MKNIYNKGITIVELMIVIAIIIILVAVALPKFSEMRNIEVLKSATEDVLSMINKARTQTLSSVDSSEYGVHFQSDKVIIFKGTNYSAGASTNEELLILTPANISNINLTSGATNLYFSRLTGNPSRTGTVTISNGSFTRIITISATGIASAN